MTGWCTAGVRLRSKRFARGFADGVGLARERRLRVHIGPRGRGGRTRRKVSQAKVWVEPLVDFSCLTQPRPESDWIVTAHRHMIAKGDDANGFGFGFGGRA